MVYTDNNPLSHLQSAKLGAVEQRWAAELALFNFKMKYRPGRANGNADALSRVARGNHEKGIPHADDLAEIQLENISATQSTPVPVELRELVTTYTSQEQLSTSILETTFTSLPSHSPPEFRDMQIADPVISRLHYYRQNNRNPPPPPKERRGETRDAIQCSTNGTRLKRKMAYCIESFKNPIAANENS